MKKPFSFHYFSADKSYEENKKLYRKLCLIHHPDIPGGNLGKMQEITSEWNEMDTQEKFELLAQAEQPFFGDIDFAFTYGGVRFKAKQRAAEKEKTILFKGMKFNLNDAGVREKVAMHFGGLGLMEFLHTKEWQQHINGE